MHIKKEEITNLEVDPLTCPRCKGSMGVISFIEEEQVIKKVLKHPGLWDVKRKPLKKFNDTLGHAAGDLALRTVAQGISKNLRPLDLGARFGGEEFVVILPDTDADGTRVAANRLREAISKTAIKSSDEKSLSLCNHFCRSGPAQGKRGRRCYFGMRRSRTLYS